MRALTPKEAFGLAMQGKVKDTGWSKWYDVEDKFVSGVGVFKTGFLTDELNEWLDANNEDGESIRLIYNFGFKLQFKDESTLVAYLLKFGK